MARSESLPEAAPPQTRAEYLRDHHFHQGKWYFPNSSEAPTDIGQIYSRIQKIQEELAVVLERKSIVDQDYDDIRRAKDRADGAVRNAQDKLDILKLALSDALEIPK